jgi:hypothetical protein
LITHYNLFLEKELLRLLDTFKADNIMAVPFKGPLLAVAIYGDMLLRECGDLDFLIKRKDVRIAINLLVSLGYRPDPKHQLDFEAHFIHEETRSIIDLHWVFF